MNSFATKHNIKKKIALLLEKYKARKAGLTSTKSFKRSPKDDLLNLSFQSIYEEPIIKKAIVANIILNILPSSKVDIECKSKS